VGEDPVFCSDGYGENVGFLGDMFITSFNVWPCVKPLEGRQSGTVNERIYEGQKDAESSLVLCRRFV
jgi:hypothetical protein